MQCAAHYEIRTDASIVKDDHWLEINHPKGLFRARLKNIVRKDFSTPFLLTLYLYFDAPSLQEAHETADERLVDCLNMLVLTTSCSFSRHRIRQIVDATPGITGMRDVHMWGDAVAHENPHPVLNEKVVHTADHLLNYDIPPALRRAMRWYRIGVNANTPDDQFQYFWFALEIVAVSKEPLEKVNDQCPVCKTALYCEKCETHPKHWPYEKQKIRSLIQAVDKECNDAKLEMLEKARNTLMHGGTLKEIQDKLPQPHEEIIDTLGRIVLLALVNQFPQELLLSEKLIFLQPHCRRHKRLPIRPG